MTSRRRLRCNDLRRRLQCRRRAFLLYICQAIVRIASPRGAPIALSGAHREAGREKYGSSHVAAALAAQKIAQFGGSLVLFRGDRPGELLGK